MELFRLDERWKVLKNVDLNSEEIRNLYFEFFENKDPYDIMFTLP